MGFDLYIKLFMVLVFFISTCQQIPELILKPVKSIFLAVVRYTATYIQGQHIPNSHILLSMYTFITDLSEVPSDE